VRYRVIVSLKLSTAPVEAFSWVYCQASSGIVLYLDIVYGLLKLLSVHRSELLIISTGYINKILNYKPYQLFKNHLKS
jgi:hypothetical protein